MNTICKWIILLAPVFCALTAGAQGTGKEKAKKEKTVEIHGEVYDSFTKARMYGKFCIMTADSTVITEDSLSGYKTNSFYIVDVPKRDDKYIIRIESDGYETSYTDYELKITGRKQQYIVPTILIKRKADDIFKDVELGGVVVTGTKVQVAYKGDTIVYDASAFNLPEGSMLDALVRQLPGAELKDNGDIYINGEKIDYLTLNGKDFFKGKNKIMLENLPYFTVKDIKVYHKSTEMSDMLGREVEEKEFVMDVRLKREYARGSIVNAEGGMGTEDRYMSRAFGLYYDDHTRISAFGNINNVNEDRKPGNDGDWTPSGRTQGLLATKYTGVHLQTEDKEKRVEETFDATVRWTDGDNVSGQQSETFAADGNINKWNQNVSRSKDFSFYTGNKIHFRKINLRTYMTMNYFSSNYNNERVDSTKRGVTLVNSRHNLYRSENKYLSFNWGVFWYKPFNNGDSFFANFYGNYYRNQPTDRFDMETTKYDATGEEQLKNRYFDSRDNYYRYSFEMGYIYALPDKWDLEASVIFTQDRKTDNNLLYRLDRLDSEIYDHLGIIPVSEEDRLLAFDTENSVKNILLTRNYYLDLQLQKYTEKYNIRFTLPLSHISEKLDYMQSTLDTVATRNKMLFQPSILYKRFGNTPITLRYSLSVKQPYLKRMMPVVDTSDELSLYISNPDLKSTINHKSSGQITFKNLKTGGSTFAGFDIGVSQRFIGRRTTYNSTTGAYVYKDGNVDGNWNASVKGGTDMPVDKAKRLRFGIDGSVKYERSVDFAVSYDEANNVLSKVDNVYTRLNTKLTYRFKTLSAGIVGKLTVRHSTGNIDNFETIDVFDYQFGGNLQYTIPVIKLNVSTDMNMFSRRGYASSTMNTDDLIWNAQISRSFMKGCIMAKLSAFDILHQLSNVRYTVNAQGRTERWYNSIPRYVMLSLAYSFKQKPNKK